MTELPQIKGPRDMTYAEWAVAGHPSHDDWRVECWDKLGSYFVTVNGRRAYGPYGCKGVKAETSRVLYCSRCKASHRFDLKLMARHEGALGRTMHYFSPLPCRVQP